MRGINSYGLKERRRLVIFQTIYCNARKFIRLGPTQGVISFPGHPQVFRFYLTAVEKNQGKAWYYHHVESSNCKVFCTQQRHCDRHNYCLPHSWSQSEWKRSSFHSIKAVVSQVGALLLLNKYITATQLG